MSETDIIVVENIPDTLFSDIVGQSVRYALLSLPYTFNRLGTTDIRKRLMNIAKGKIAEKIFSYYCEINRIAADFDACSTPFWLPDQRDFIMGEIEWDIKNNFIYPGTGEVTFDKLLLLPALIPNHHNKDQWSARGKMMHKASKSVYYVFTFMPMTVDRKNNGKAFFEITLDEAELLQAFTKPQKIENFEKNDQTITANKVLDNLGFLDNDGYRLNAVVPMYITGVAGPENFYLFKNTGISEQNAAYRWYKDKEWYVKKDGYLNFGNGIIRTTITNACCPVGLLPSFNRFTGKS